MRVTAGHIVHGLPMAAAALLLCTAPNGAMAVSLDWQDPYLTGDPLHYPQPQAVELHRLG